MTKTLIQQVCSDCKVCITQPRRDEHRFHQLSSQAPGSGEGALIRDFEDDNNNNSDHPTVGTRTNEPRTLRSDRTLDTTLINHSAFSRFDLPKALGAYTLRPGPRPPSCLPAKPTTPSPTRPSAQPTKAPSPAPPPSAPKRPSKACAPTPQPAHANSATSSHLLSHADRRIELRRGWKTKYWRTLTLRRTGSSKR